MNKHNKLRIKEMEEVQEFIKYLGLITYRHDSMGVKMRKMRERAKRSAQI